jgi:DNA-binding NarL/FixJ family response regulator
MLKLTQQQLDAFAPQLTRQFEEQCVVLLRDRYGKISAAYPDEKLLEFVRFGMERAKRHGIVAFSEIERWLHLMVRLGPRFDDDERYAEASAFVADGDISEQAHMDRLEQSVAAALAGKR